MALEVHIQFPGRPEQSVKDRLKRLMGKVQLRLETGPTKTEAEHHAEELFKAIAALRDSNQLYVWPGSESDGDQTFVAGQEMYLVRLDENGQPHLSPEKIRLPKYPASFIAGVEAHLNGLPWEEVKTILTREPDFDDKETAKTIRQRIRETKSPRDLANLMKAIAPTITNKKLRGELLQDASSWFDRLVHTQAKEADSFEVLQRFQVDVRHLIDGMSSYNISPVGALDALDDAAVLLAHRLFDKAKTTADVERVSNELSQYSFAFEDLYKQPLAEKASDVRAKIGFFHTLRYARSDKTLAALRNKVEEYQFSDEEVGALLKAELFDLIDKKRSKYHSK